MLGFAVLVHIAQILELFGAFLGRSSDISWSWRHQRSLGHEKVKSHVQCSSRLSSFGCFEPILGLFWAKNGCFWPKTAQIWEGTSGLGVPAPGRHW